MYEVNKFEADNCQNLEIRDVLSLYQNHRTLEIIYINRQLIPSFWSYKIAKKGI